MVDQELKLLSPSGLLVGCRVEYDPAEHPPTLAVLESPIGKGSYTGADLWWCLIKFRVAIEPAGWRVLCQGARKNVWPSGMSASMSNGIAAYVLDARKSPQLVRIFDEAAPQAVVGLWEQAAWCDALHEQIGGRTQMLRAEVAKWSSPT